MAFEGCPGSKMAYFKGKEVPCCSGLLRLAEQAGQAANRKAPIKYIVVGIQGEILQEAWV